MNHRDATAELACLHVFQVAAAHDCVDERAISASARVVTACAALQALLARRAQVTTTTLTTSAPLIHTCSARAISP
jgi:hypothetical protein